MKAPKKISQFRQKREDARRKMLEHPEEWDFRSVKEDVLDLAILYEYARSTQWVLDEFERWHEQPITLSTDSEYFDSWNGKKVGEILNYILTSPETLPHDVGHQLWQSQPSLLQESPLADLTDISIHFPLPFTFISERVKLASFGNLAPPWIKNPCGFEIIKSLPNYSQRQLDSSSRAGILYLTVKVDLRVGKTQLAEDAQKRLLKLYQENPTAKPLPTGAAADLPWTHLKELAAYRLYKACFDDETAKSALADFSKKNPLSAERYEDELLPRYGRSGWWKAIANAKKRIRKLFPRPAAE